MGGLLRGANVFYWDTEDHFHEEHGIHLRNLTLSQYKLRWVLIKIQLFEWATDG